MRCAVEKSFVEGGIPIFSFRMLEILKRRMESFKKAHMKLGLVREYS